MFKKVKNIVLTLAVGDQYLEVSKLTHNSIRKYAKKIGADFLVVEKSNCTTPHWQKLIEIEKCLEKYDRVLYLDTDIIIREDCPNLFKIVDVDKIGLFNEAPFTNRSKELLIDTCKEYGTTLDGWNGKYYNTGVMLIPKKYKDIFTKPDKEYFSFYEQTYLNMVFSKYNVDVFDLTHKFNRMSCMDSVTGEERFDSYLIHYAGCPNTNVLLNTVKNDLNRWDNDKNSGYRYKKHILIRVGGGLGDQICAEPAIRFLSKYLYKNDDVNVLTHWPDIFEHIEGIKVFSYNNFVFSPDTPYFITDSLPGPETINWSIVSNLLCHTVDYCSISLMKRTLPILDKTIILKYKDQDLKNVENLIKTDLKTLTLVHAGKHWSTKTFPEKWWNKVIENLIKNGHNVCLIGKDTDDRGTVNLKKVDNVIDVRNKLTLKELFALISQAKTLISNDSAPIHIAGAFDNNIILIPSCKHPDHILPWRCGNIYYKAKSLYKKLIIDDVSAHPTQVYSTTLDFIVDDWNKYLIEPESVV